MESDVAALQDCQVELSGSHRPAGGQKLPEGLLKWRRKQVQSNGPAGAAGEAKHLFGFGVQYDRLPIGIHQCGTANETIAQSLGEGNSLLAVFDLTRFVNWHNDKLLGRLT